MWLTFEGQRLTVPIRRRLLLPSVNHIFLCLVISENRWLTSATLIFVSVSIFIPFRVDSRFILICLQRATFQCFMRRGNTGQRHGNGRGRTYHFIARRGVRSNVVRTIRYVLFCRVISSRVRVLVFSIQGAMCRFMRCQRRRSSHRVKGRRASNSNGNLIRRSHSYCSTRRRGQGRSNGYHGDKARRQDGCFNHPFVTDLFRQISSYPMLNGIFHCSSQAISRRARDRSRPKSKSSVRQRLTRMRGGRASSRTRRRAWPSCYQTLSVPWRGSNSSASRGRARQRILFRIQSNVVRRFHLITTSARVSVQVSKDGMVHRFYRYLFRIVRVFVHLLSCDRHCHPFPIKGKDSNLFLQRSKSTYRVFRLGGVIVFPSVGVLSVFQYTRRYQRLSVMLMVTIACNRTAQFCVIEYRYNLRVIGYSLQRFRRLRIQGGLWLPFRGSNRVCRYRFKRLFSAAFSRHFNGLTGIRRQSFICFAMDTITFRYRVRTRCKGVDNANFSCP